MTVPEKFLKNITIVYLTELFEMKSVLSGCAIPADLR